MEKASSFFVIIINDLYDEVIYVKKFGRPVGIILATAYLGFILGLEFVKGVDWQSLLILFAMFLVWALVVFANLATFFENRSFKFLGFEISAKENTVESSNVNDKFDSLSDLKEEINNLKESNNKLSSRIEEVNNRITKLHPVPPKMTFDDSIRLILYMDRGLNAKNTTYNDVRSNDSTFADFYHQIEYAKQHNIEISSSKNYRKVLNIYLNVISNHLLAQLVLMYGDNVNSFKDTIKKALNQYPYSKETLLAVRDELIEKYGKKSQCTLLFEEIIKKLDKMY